MPTSPATTRDIVARNAAAGSRQKMKVKGTGLNPILEGFAVCSRCVQKFAEDVLIGVQ
jgi:hypothetical protein